MGRLTPEEIEHIHEVFAQTRNLTETARITGHNSKTVGRHVEDKRKKEHEQETRTEASEDDKALEAYALFDQEKSPVEVALTLRLRAPKVEEYQAEYWRLEGLHSLKRGYDILRKRGFKGGYHSILDLVEKINSGDYTEDEVKETLQWVGKLTDLQSQVIELRAKTGELEKKTKQVEGADQKIAEMNRAASNLKDQREEAAKIPPELLSPKGRREAILNFEIELIPILKPGGVLDLVELALEAFIGTAVEDPELLEYLKRASTVGPDKIPPPPPGLILAFSAEVGKRIARRASQMEREKTSQSKQVLSAESSTTVPR